MDITISLAKQLVSSQFPQWADLPISNVKVNGWDNRTFRLGDDMTVRLPSAEWYILQVEKEQHWLPRLAPHLPLPIPVPVAVGMPSDIYPWPWSIYRWLDGEIATIDHIIDLSRFATALADFLLALQRIDATDGPAAGPHNFYRGGPLSVYDAETRQAIKTLGGEVDAEAATALWETALATHWEQAPVWVHGDVSEANLLVQEGQLCAVIDFGSSGVGDPACDMAIAWTLLSGESREVFRTTLGVDSATWNRGRGWVLWKGLITLAGNMHTNPGAAEKARHVIQEVLADDTHTL